jgi:hypothetical protein
MQSNQVLNNATFIWKIFLIGNRGTWTAQWRIYRGAVDGFLRVLLFVIFQTTMVRYPVATYDIIILQVPFYVQYLLPGSSRYGTDYKVKKERSSNAELSKEQGLANTLTTD